MTTNHLKGARISLRALEPSDLELLYQWENDTEIWSISETLSPISKYILKKYLDSIHKDIYETRQLRLMIQRNDDSSPLGTIDLYDFDPIHRRAAVGILIAEKAERRKGYARESLGILSRYCRDILKLHQLYCYIREDNTSSIELFRQSGFATHGIRKEWHWDGSTFRDEFILQAIL
jgi:diamine N-acetyltransferase